MAPRYFLHSSTLIPALAGALVILLAYIGQYFILSLKDYIADMIIKAQTGISL